MDIGDLQEGGVRIDGKRRSAGVPLRVPAATLRLFQAALRPGSISVIDLFQFFRFSFFLL